MMPDVTPTLKLLNPIFVFYTKTRVEVDLHPELFTKLNGVYDLSAEYHGPAGEVTWYVVFNGKVLYTKNTGCARVILSACTSLGIPVSGRISSRPTPDRWQTDCQCSRMPCQGSLP